MASMTPPDSGEREAWTVRLSCCGRDDGSFTASSWTEADAFREHYLNADGHKRSAIIESVAREVSIPLSLAQRILAALEKEADMDAGFVPTGELVALAAELRAIVERKP